MSETFPLLAVDIGNSRVKLGRFAAPPPEGLPTPDATLQLAWRGDALPEALAAWCAEHAAAAAHHWAIASVNRPTEQRLVAWIARARPQDTWQVLTHEDLPVQVDLPEPVRVGVDRLLGAVAANCLRAAGQAAVVVDLGSAITVDLVSAAGAFQGGAILPGIRMAAQALHEQTDLLPDVAMSDLSAPPPAIGKATVPAIQSGLYWGAVGAVRELCARFAPDEEPLVLLTGGAAPVVAQLLGGQARYVAHLILAGIAVAQGAPR